MFLICLNPFQPIISLISSFFKTFRLFVFPNNFQSSVRLLHYDIFYFVAKCKQ